jgi:hypothetical protein
MSSERIKLVSGDNRPYVRVTLADKDGSPINLSDATTSVVVYFRATGSTTVLATLPCSKVDGGAGGVVTFNFPGTTLDVPPGPYEGEVEISFGGEKQTVYQPLKFLVRSQFS